MARKDLALGSDKVSDLPSDEALKFDKAALPKPIPNQTLVDYIYGNEQLANYWGVLTDTANALETSRFCYISGKAAANGKNTSSFAGVDKVRAEDYATRFVGYEQKFVYVKEQLAALKTAFSNLGFKIEAASPHSLEPMQFLEHIISSMDSADFNKVEPEKIAIIRLEPF
jgi:hypothetical protein